MNEFEFINLLYTKLDYYDDYCYILVAMNLDALNLIF